jgi:integrase
MGRRQGGVRPATARSLTIDFYYRGVRCRERIKLEPTPRNLRWAENLLGQIRVEIEKGTFDYARHFPTSKKARSLAKRPGGLSTVTKALETWLDGRRAEIEHTTEIDYDRAIRNTLIPAFGSTLLRDLTRTQIKDWIAGHATLSAKRLNNVLSPLRQMLAEAFEDGHIESNPMQGLTLRRRRQAESSPDVVDPFSPAEITAILEKASGQFRNVIQFWVASGLRTSEVIALRWANVDLVHGTVHVSAAFVRGRRKVTKTSAGTRTVSLLPQAIAALRAQRQHTQAKGGAVFENPATLTAWESDKQIREWNWRPLLMRAGVRYRSPRQLRHTYASTMLSAGENVMWVAQQLGHKDWSITARKYARFIPTAAPEAGAKGAAVWSTFGQLIG